MRISIFTPVHKTHKFFDMCIDSICNQTFQDWEWVILDNAKSEDIGDIIRAGLKPESIEEYVRQYVKLKFEARSIELMNKIKVYKQLDDCKNIGHLKNIASRLCVGDIIVEQDYDDYLLPNALDVISQAADNTDADFFYTDWNNMQHNEMGQWETRVGRYDIDKACIIFQGRETPINVFGLQQINLQQLKEGVIPLHLRIWRREFLALIDGFDSGLFIADDYDIMYKSFLFGKCCRISYPCVVINYYHKNTTDTLDLEHCKKVGEEVYARYAKALNEKKEPLHIVTFIPKILK